MTTLTQVLVVLVYSIHVFTTHVLLLTLTQVFVVLVYSIHVLMAHVLLLDWTPQAFAEPMGMLP